AVQSGRPPVEDAAAGGLAHGRDGVPAAIDGRPAPARALEAIAPARDLGRGRITALDIEDITAVGGGDDDHQLDRVREEVPPVGAVAPAGRPDVDAVAVAGHDRSVAGDQGCVDGVSQDHGAWV